MNTQTFHSCQRLFLACAVTTLALLSPRVSFSADFSESLKLMNGGNPRAAIEIAMPRAEGGDTFAQYIVGKSYILANETAEGLRWLNRAADLGESFSQKTLAELYLEGKVVKKDVDLAVTLLEQVAGRSGGLVPLAQNMLGDIYQWPEHGVQDNQKAAAWHLKAAQSGYAPSQLALATIQYFRLKKPDNTLRWAMAAAEQGYMPAYMIVGFIHQNGFGTPRNYTEAMKWFLTAYENRAINAPYEIGAMHSLGQGTPRDIQQAVNWYQKGAELGDPLAQLAYSRALIRGVEVGRNDGLAFEYASKASAANHAPADAYLGTLYERGIGAEKDPQRAAALFEKSANAGAVLGMVEMGRALENGIGVAQDIVAAVKWYRKAAALGYPRAHYEMGRIYDLGKGVEASNAAASKWFFIAANGGFSPAQFLIGRSEMRAQNREVQAYAWLTLAAQGGSPAARKLLPELAGRMTQEQIVQAQMLVSRFEPRTQRVPEDASP